MDLLFPSWKERAGLVGKTVQRGAVSNAGSFRTVTPPWFGELTGVTRLYPVVCRVSGHCPALKSLQKPGAWSPSC